MILLFVCKILFTLLRRISRHKYALRDSVNAVFSSTKAFLFCFQFTIVLNIHNRGTLETMHSSSYYAKTSNTGIWVLQNTDRKPNVFMYLNTKINLHDEFMNVSRSQTVWLFSAFSIFEQWKWNEILRIPLIMLCNPVCYWRVQV